MIDGEAEVLRENPPVPFFYTANSKCPGLGSNPDRRGRNPATVKLKFL
jgi:hypothetical protein